MILDDDFDVNLCCSHKYYTYWWQKLQHEEQCVAAIEQGILNIPLENFECWQVQDTMDYIRRTVEKILEEHKVNLQVNISRGSCWFGITFMKYNKLRREVTYAHLFINEKE